ncbi:MBL fold metallo-hydrolase [Halobacillus sp. BAB-2008]|uniref:MBL fold metallo-hydrolase n=1 Tax=Halobacillus sp. BAB-2008 TaxID=1246484 RepID=UPI0002A51A3C|nr:MBL fold metallo-hydrolase [Halobacillus sp. BAB-2008]ELK44858.1 beta-lactamase domain-containing protein [Halobacillus sp. BAB-2008]
MYLKYFYDRHLAQASYMVGCQASGEAAIIDPSRNINVYLETARREGYTLTKAFETHIHADFVSGVTELARRTGATIYHSTEGADNGGYELPSSLPTHGLKDGETITLGNVQIKAIHTPGHTPEHMSFELTDGAAADKPIGVFTGDFVFVGDVGRPDLLEKSAGVKNSTENGARQMFRSLEAFKNYEDYIQIWPGHGAGSACGKSLGAVPTSTVGYEKLYNPAFQFEEEEAFLSFLLEGQTEPPAYFTKMKQVNPTGMTPLSDVNPSVEMERKAEDMARLAASRNAMVIDTRNAFDYANRHLPGTINLPFPDVFAEWMGRLADYEKDIYIIADPPQFQEIRSVLSSMGMDRLKGLFSLSALSKTEAPRSYTNELPKEVAKRDIPVLDVRYDHEWNESHIPGAEHVPLPQLPETELHLPGNKVAVHCASGKRSAVAASILLNKGYEVINVTGGFHQWKKENLPVT